MTFFPLDREIRKSSIWAQGSPILLKVWLYLLLEADPRTGVVTDAIPAIAMGCNLEMQQVEQCLADLEAPDPFSRSETDDGRRIKRIRTGIKILNYRKYASKDYSTPRVKKWRERQKKRGETVKRVSSVTETTNTNKDTDTDTKKRSLGGADGSAAMLPLESAAQWDPTSEPVCWDNVRQTVELNERWLREQLEPLSREARVRLTPDELRREHERLRLRCLKEPRLRACIRKASDGKPSKRSQFKSMATLAVSHFSEAILRKAERVNAPARASPNTTEARSARTDDAFREAMEQAQRKERQGP